MHSCSRGEFMTAQGLIEHYGLQPHPEGGWYREVHRSSHSLGGIPGYSGERSALTVIYFLLSAGNFSVWHRVKSEEVWLHLAGAPLELVVLQKDPAVYLLDHAGAPGQPLAVVPCDALQAARTLGDFTFVSCLVAPGFDFADFEIPTCDEIVASHPLHEQLVRQFCRS
ncbi:cupin domain-containing protein [Geomonas sp. RF6]|uniref:cupin domain-containing protein n=1 Tax=Geomonas sp. RF6 TaxID=2897342 RepID=UPI001E4B1A41|nr:cupin domain-containing protein [Geomonas sp. RF6]UFS71149.1 cupin domain-containing protein [Geomonas sp. RF6]